MPFVANTPESLLGRSDSKDPRSTCRGITSSGLPCRRGIARAASTTLRPARRPDPADESLYCWQHKEQASVSAHSSPGPRRHSKPILEERSSLDTLADRLGLVTVHAGKYQSEKPNGKPTTVQHNGSPSPPRLTRPKPKQKLQCCLCFSVPLEPVPESPPPRLRPQPRPVQQTSQVPGGSRPTKPRPYDAATSPGKQSHRSRKSNTSQTARLKDLIPDTVDAATASALLAELARPYADAEEPGYIYMFWLTPASRQAAPPVDAARSLLSPPSTPASHRRRRPSDVVSRFADPDAGTGKATMLLKIGRAANVQRRMNQWQRQCGYDIEMLRYYPYVAGASDASATSGAGAPRMTPHCRRVERLVHLELAEMGLRAAMGSCEACGRDHREWFEVVATREDVRRVDDVIRRWVEWDEREGS
ncbi:SpvB domain-containing protein [Purpureocillium lavendulum]|uniref:SpvB domain-containing protein n=1 Tax=Purpureocillium lavendulum TaxID=1247861 RepID=A0AB34FF89_9HYPO|nr:SpvB domain-containing protein [Purpureocillium lavendulum]